MSDQQHTAEPWKLTADEHSQIIVDVEGNEICLLSDEANARRIVACVNACAGISTDVLEKYWPNGGLVANVEIHQRAEQRDELLAVLKDRLNNFNLTATQVAERDAHLRQFIAEIEAGNE